MPTIALRATLLLAALLLAPACAEPDRRAPIDAFYRAFNATVRTGIADPDLARLVAEDYRQHEPGIAQGRAGLVVFLMRLHAKMPTLSCRVDDAVAQGDRVVARTRCSTPDQPAGEITVDAFRVVHGRLTEHWNWGA